MNGRYFNSYYVYSNAPDYGLSGWGEGTDFLNDKRQTEFLQSVADSVVAMVKGKGYDIDLVVLNGQRLKWAVADLDDSEFVLVEFMDYHSGKGVQDIRARW